MLRYLTLTAALSLLQTPGLSRAAEAEPAPAAPVEHQAQEHYLRGIERYDSNEFALALVEFERAYAIRPSYKLLFNIGQVYYQLNQYAKARRALEQYLSEGGAAVQAERRQQVETDLHALKLRTATIVVKINVAGAEVAIDDDELRLDRLREQRLVDAGVRRITASKPGYSVTRRTVSVAGGEVVEVELFLLNLAPVAPAPKPPNTRATVAWISAGSLVAAAVGTGVATLIAHNDYEKLRGEPLAGTAAQAESRFQRQAQVVNTLSLTTDILAGAAALTGGVALYFTLSGPSVQDKEKETRRVAIQAGPRGFRASCEF